MRKTKDRNEYMRGYRVRTGKKYKGSEECKEKIKLKMKKIKINIVKEMGGKCICCGLTQWWILTFDHIKPLNGKKRLNTLVLLWKLHKDKELRKEFQIMCYGCNSSKFINESCGLDHNLN